MKGYVIEHADGLAPSQDAAPADGRKLWLWRNGDHYLAFEHLYPCFTPGGDPMVLGEPVGYAVMCKSYDRAARPAPSNTTTATTEPVAVRDADDIDCPHAHECFNGNRFGKGCYIDELQSAMGGKSWHECHCMTDEERAQLGLKPRARVADWQPIETAPKDGTSILVWTVHPTAKYASDGAGERWQCAHIAHWIDHNGGGWCWSGMAGTHTHWMPLPAAPAQTQTKGGEG